MKSFFVRTVTDWYRRHHRRLPWRETKDPYRVWVSEIILQQTRVAQGLPYYEKFIETFPGLEALANAGIDRVLRVWQGLGYYSRARNMHQTARYLSAENGGVFPQTFEELLKLKGVGDYTASAIASICFDLPVPVVDGNVYRVLSRYFSIREPVPSAAAHKLFKNFSKSLIPEDAPGIYNQAVMEFGAIQCVPSRPDCGKCPLREKCLAFAGGDVEKLPVKSPKTKTRKRYLEYIVPLTADGKTLIEKRTSNDIWKGLYQFPLIEFDKQVAPKLVFSHPLTREISGQANIPQPPEPAYSLRHKLTHRELFIRFWVLNVETIYKQGLIISWNDLSDYPVPTVIDMFNKKISRTFANI